MNIYTFNFITLNAGNMVAENNYEIVESTKAGNTYAYAKFEYDLSANSSDIREIVLNEMEQQDNALFYQLGQCQLIKNHKSNLKKIALEKNKKFRPQDVLREYLVYVDFESIFKDKNLNMPLSNEYRNQTKETLATNNDLAFRLRWMFDPENGIRLSFDGKDKNDETKVWRTFVPFDKSSSMSRSSQITFIDKELKAEVEKRLLLDMRFYKNNPDDETEEEPIKVISSKYYAYRGLYLSTGCRITHKRKGFTEAELYLNHETVIVIPDEEKILYDKKLFAAETANPKHCDENSLWTFKETTGDVESNFFDGEGLICPIYANYINKQLQDRYGFQKESHSFQIRMGFAIKGMLHEVNFQQYLNDQLAKSIFKGTLRKDDPLWIEDIFKMKRDLRKAKIILTKSMFKCAGWLTKWREYAKEGKTALFENQKDLELVKKDPMEYYFSKMEKYKHALYVTNSDARLSDNALVRLNYQFLSTLALPPKDFESLIQNQISYIKDLPKRMMESNKFEESIEANEENFIDAEENPLQQKKKDNLGEKCKKALAKNKTFYSDPQVKTIIKSERRNLEKNLCLGRLVITGEQRFLSGDLLELLRIIYQRFAWEHYERLYGHTGKYTFKIIKFNSDPKDGINKKEISVNKFTKKFQLYKQLKNLKRARLYEKHFFMPKKAITLIPHYDYAFFRNPHLARNEQCLLRPFMKKHGLYEQYFNHLTGVVMISCESLVAMALSGADFDGDLVKVICDGRVVRALQNSTYIEAEDEKEIKKNSEKKDNNGKSVKYERALPVIVIPKLKATGGSDSGSIPFKTIKNTFSNQIGQISNTAIKFARKECEYVIKDNNTRQESHVTAEEMKDGKCCAACTIITGLEIDAAKTGVHPKANINILATNVNFHDLFLEAKKGLESIYSEGKFITPFVTTGEDGSLTGHENRKETKAIKGFKNLHVYNAEYFATKNTKAETKVESATEIKTDEIATDKDPIANIDWLPGRYLNYFKTTAEEGRARTVPNGNKILFTFQTEENWEKDLLPGTKEKLYPLAEAYLKIRELARKINITKEFINNQKFIRYVKTMLKIQYDNLGQKLKFDGINEKGEIKTYEVSIQDALDQTYSTVYAAIEKNAVKQYEADKEEQLETDETELRLDDYYRDEIREALNRLIQNQWQYTTTEEERSKLISEIIKSDTDIDLPTAMIKLLSNFTAEGHMIFYYVLKDVQNHYCADIDSKAYLRYTEKKTEDDDESERNNTNNKTVINDTYKVLTTSTEKPNYYDELYAFYSELSTRKKVEWKRELAQKCRNKMQEIMRAENNVMDEEALMDRALKYVFSIPRRQPTAKGAPKIIIDSGRSFLWNVFTTEEILRNVYEVPKDN